MSVRCSKSANKKRVATAHLYDTSLGLIVIVKNSTFCKCGWRALFCFVFHVSFAGLGFAERG